MPRKRLITASGLAVLVGLGFMVGTSGIAESDAPDVTAIATLVEADQAKADNVGESRPVPTEPTGFAITEHVAETAAARPNHRALTSTTSPIRACRMTRTGEYSKAQPKDVGIDAAKLREALDYATLNGSDTVKVFRHSCLAGEGRKDVLFDRIPRINWSQTKTVAALVTGAAERKGYVDVDAPIDRYLPEGTCDAKHRKVTIRHLLTMSAGHKMNWTRGLNFVDSQSRAREFCTQVMAHKPGSYYEYDQQGPGMLTYAVQHAIWRHEPKTDFQEFAQRELFNKLGIPQSAYWWERDRSGNTHGYSHLYLRPLEFGRLGELMLNEGTYQGGRIIDRSYMRQLRAPAATNCGYGFLVWRNGCGAGQHQVNGSIFNREVVDPAQPWIASAPADMYYTWGYHGQHTFVIPSLDMVVTRSGEQQLDMLSGALKGDGDAAIAGRQKEGYHEFFRLLMDSVIDMPAKASALIANSGPYSGGPELNFDPDPFLYPIDAIPGTYLSVGPGAPEGCNTLECEGESNDGTVRWMSDVPRTVPGILGAEERPNG